jgi:hypothetical protein
MIVRKQVYLFLLIFLYLVFTNCDIFSIDPLPGRNNPIDPGNPGYQPPSTTLIHGPENGTTVNTHQVEFEWEGNQQDQFMYFSYKLDDVAWSSWSKEKTATFEFLDEGEHNFSIKSKYINDIEQDNPTNVNFVIDAVQGSSLMFVPRTTKIGFSFNSVAEIFVEEASEFAGVKIEIDFDQTKIYIIDVEIYQNSQSILLKNSGTLIHFVELDQINGKIKIDLAVAGGNPPNVNGTGPLGKIRFRSLKQFIDPIEMTFNTNCELRDENNQSIIINALINQIINF